MSNFYKEHEALREWTNLELQKEFRGLRLFTRHVGQYYIRRILKGNAIDYRRIQIGQKGQCDDWGVLPCFSIGSPINQNRAITQCNQIVFPVHLEWETKAGESGLNKAQEIWRVQCENLNWLWFLNRDPAGLIYEIKQQLNKKGLVPWIPLNNHWQKK